MSATIKDIAKRTGLGLATISSYLNGGNVREKNRIKIEEAIEELHFEVNEVARGLKTNRTKTIGVVIPELNNIFCAQIITEVEDILRGHGYATMICDCRTDEKLENEAVEFLLHRRVDGIINMPVHTNGSHLKKVIRMKKPIVLIDRKLEDVSCDCVLVDNFAAAKDAVNRLILAGHKKIGMLAGPQDIFTAQERFNGYRAAFDEAGILVDEKLIGYSDYTIAGGAKAMERLLQNNQDMTAVFVSNYEMTMGAVIGLNEQGIHIPKSLSLIGFDNEDFAKACSPRLSIVSQPTKAIAKEVARLMLCRLEGIEGPIEKVKLKTAFIEGKSVKTKRMNQEGWQ